MTMVFLPLASKRQRGNSMYYYLSIGTNVQPEKNAVKIVELLTQNFGPIVMYPFVYTKPDNMPSGNMFLNSAAVVFSLLTITILKNQLNTIETRLGRDRNDPHRSTKDRTADIDILGHSERFCGDFFCAFDEPYIKAFSHTTICGADLQHLGLPPTQGATTVDFDTGAGHVRILENAADRLEYWHKSALALK